MTEIAAPAEQQQPIIDSSFRTATGLIDLFRNKIIESYWTMLQGLWIETSFLAVSVVQALGGFFRAILQWEGSLNDFTATLTIGPNFATLSVLGRAAGNGATLNGYVAQTDGLLLQLYRADAGALTILGLPSGVVVAGDTIALRCLGGNIEALLNGVSLGAVADATYAAGYIGIATRNAGVDMTQFVVTSP